MFHCNFIKFQIFVYEPVNLSLQSKCFEDFPYFYETVYTFLIIPVCFFNKNQLFRELFNKLWFSRLFRVPNCLTVFCANSKAIDISLKRVILSPGVDATYFENYRNHQ